MLSQKKKLLLPINEHKVFVFGKRNVDFLLKTVLPELVLQWFLYFSTDTNKSDRVADQLNMLSQAKAKPQALKDMLGLFIREFKLFSSETQIEGFDWEQIYEQAGIKKAVPGSSLEGFIETVIRQTEKKLDTLRDDLVSREPFKKPSLRLAEDISGEQMYCGNFFLHYPAIMMENAGHMYFSLSKMKAENILLVGSFRPHAFVSPGDRVKRMVTKLFRKFLDLLDQWKDVPAVHKVLFFCPFVSGPEAISFNLYFPLFRKQPLYQDSLYTVHGVACFLSDFFKNRKNIGVKQDNLKLNGLGLALKDLSSGETDWRVEVKLDTMFPWSFPLSYHFILWKTCCDSIYIDKLRKPVSGASMGYDSLVHAVRTEDEKKQLPWLHNLLVLMASQWFFKVFSPHSGDKTLNIRLVHEFVTMTIDKTDIPNIVTRTTESINTNWDAAQHKAVSAKSGGGDISPSISSLMLKYT